jgi:hypothetical protein
MTMPHGGPRDLAGLADDRPLTYNDEGPSTRPARPPPATGTPS